MLSGELAAIGLALDWGAGDTRLKVITTAAIAVTMTAVVARQMASAVGVGFMRSQTPGVALRFRMSQD